jgi:hypothetical protein
LGRVLKRSNAMVGCFVNDHLFYLGSYVSLVGIPRRYRRLLKMDSAY